MSLLKPTFFFPPKMTKNNFWAYSWRMNIRSYGEMHYFIIEFDNNKKKDTV